MDKTCSFADALISESLGKEKVIPGNGLVPGIAMGTAYLYEVAVPEVKSETIPSEEVDQELTLLDEALQQARQEIETLQVLAHQSLEPEQEAIFEARALMLRDEEFLETIRERIRDERESAGAALKTVLREYRTRLSESKDPYLRERKSDLLDLETHLRRALLHGRVASEIQTHSIVVVQRLTATDVLHLKRHGLLGCVVAEGGSTSHAALILKALEVPTLVGGQEALQHVASGDPVILDGKREQLILRPTLSRVGTYKERELEQEAPLLASGFETKRPAVTTDGQTIPLRANVNVEDNLHLLEASGAEGVGLLRTEMMFLADRGGILSEDQQASLYREIASATHGKTTTVRLLDLGGEKRLPLTPEEPNPSLGWRGIRILIDRQEELLRPQLRALLRANTAGDLRALLPMVAELAEVQEVRAILADERERLSEQGIDHDPDLPLGMMVEVPAAALRTSLFAEHIDFFSIGTNDLTQFTLAADRTNEQTADRCDALHPAVLDLVRGTVRAAKSENRPVEICGESAADAHAIPVFLGLGVDALSATPQSLPAMRQLIRSISLEESRHLADKVLDAPSAAKARRRAREWLEIHAPSRFSTEGLPNAESVQDGA